MRMIFGVLGLLVVLAIVGTIARKQLQAVKALPGTAPTAAAASAPGNVAQQSRDLQNQVKQDVNALLQQGASRPDAGQ